MGVSRLRGQWGASWEEEALLAGTGEAGEGADGEMESPSSRRGGRLYWLTKETVGISKPEDFQVILEVLRRKEVGWEFNLTAFFAPSVENG